jgi:uncharacterized membrane protein YkoI
VAATIHTSGDDNDHERVRRLVQEGHIRPLVEIIETVHADVPGEILEVEFDIEDNVYVYKFKILKPNGNVQEVEVDAATGKVVETEDED